MYRKTLSEICPRVFFSSLESTTLKNLVFNSLWEVRFVGGIVLGIVGIALCSVNCFIYTKLVSKKRKSLLPVIDETEEKFANVLEKGNDLLQTDLI